MELFSENILLLECLKRKKDLAKIEELLSAVSDWDDFLKKVSCYHLEGFVYETFSRIKNTELLPSYVLKSINQDIADITYRNSVQLELLKTIIHNWNSNGISSIVLNDIFLLEYIYNNIGIKRLTNIDILITEQSLEKAAKILRNIDFEVNDDFLKSLAVEGLDKKKNDYKSGINIYANIYSEKDIYAKDVWTNNKQLVIHNSMVYTLNPTYVLFELCMQLYNNLSDKRNNLIRYIDIAWTMDKCQKEINWIELEELCNIHNVKQFVSSIVHLSIKYFNIRITNNSIKNLFQTEIVKYENQFLNLLQDPKEINHQVERNKIVAYRNIGLVNSIKHSLMTLIQPNSLKIYRLRFQSPETFYVYLKA